MKQAIAEQENLKLTDGYPTEAISRIMPNEVRWGSRSDSDRAAKIVDSVLQQTASSMEDLKEGHWSESLKWIQAKLVLKSQTFKQGIFEQKIKPTTPIVKIFNLLIGSKFTEADEKEVLRRGLKVFLQAESRFIGGRQFLSKFHSILLAGIFEEKIFIIFEDDKYGEVVPDSDWSFVWANEHDDMETYSVESNWQINKSMGFDIREGPNMYHAEVKIRGSPKIVTGNRHDKEISVSRHAAPTTAVWKPAPGATRASMLEAHKARLASAPTISWEIQNGEPRMAFEKKKAEIMGNSSSPCDMDSKVAETDCAEDVAAAECPVPVDSGPTASETVFVDDIYQSEDGAMLKLRPSKVGPPSFADWASILGVRGRWAAQGLTGSASESTRRKGTKRKGAKTGQDSLCRRCQLAAAKALDRHRP